MTDDAAAATPRTTILTAQAICRETHRAITRNGPYAADLSWRLGEYLWLPSIPMPIESLSLT